MQIGGGWLITLKSRKEAEPAFTKIEKVKERPVAPAAGLFAFG